MLKEHLREGQVVVIRDGRLISQIKATLRALGLWRRGAPDPDRHVLGVVLGVDARTVRLRLDNGRRAAVPHGRVLCVLG